MCRRSRYVVVVYLSFHDGKMNRFKPPFENRHRESAGFFVYLALTLSVALNVYFLAIPDPVEEVSWIDGPPVAVRQCPELSEVKPKNGQSSVLERAFLDDSFFKKKPTAAVAPEKERVVEKKPDRSLPDGSPLRTDTRDYSQKRPRYSHVPNRAALNWERLKSEWERMDPSDPYYSTVFKISHMVKSLDTDQDERLTNEEWNVPAHYFRANDRNDDGFVTIDELERSLPDTHTKEEFFRIQDNDENGVIERVEFKGTPSLFDMLDTNKDKTISLGELMNSDFQP